MRILAFSGGGAKGAFQAGALSRLSELSSFHDYDLFAGVSVGALAAAFLAYSPIGRKSLLARIQAYRELWLERIHQHGAVYQPNPAYEHIIHPLVGALFHRFKHGAVFDHDPLKKLIRETLSSHSTHPSECPLRPLRVGVFSTSRVGYREIHEKHPHIESFILASASVPGAFPSVMVDGERFSDGGMYKNVPFLFLTEFAGQIKRIDLFLTFNPIPEFKISEISFGSPFKVLLGSARLASAAYNYSSILPYIRYCRTYPDCQIRVCFPTKPMPNNPLDFHREQIILDFKHGQNSVLHCFRKMLGRTTIFEE
jgi:predicted acylesterase/phospholipase RssA